MSVGSVSLSESMASRSEGCTLPLRGHDAEAVVGRAGENASSGGALTGYDVDASSSAPPPGTSAFPDKLPTGPNPHVFRRDVLETRAEG